MQGYGKVKEQSMSGGRELGVAGTRKQESVWEEA